MPYSPTIPKSVQTSDGGRCLLPAGRGAGTGFAVTVSYPYRLGGYPDYDWNVKRGEILYYLAPAALWQDFQSLTINLYLDEACL